jgi:hypothetical protein
VGKVLSGRRRTHALALLLSSTTSRLSAFYHFSFYENRAVLEMHRGQVRTGLFLNRLKLGGERNWRRKHEFYVKGSAHVSFTDFTRQRGRASASAIGPDKINTAVRAVSWL